MNETQQLKHGVNKVGRRRYYCYVDTNKMMIVIPYWYRATTTIFATVSTFVGVILGARFL
jgi:hypothetical protein